MTHLVSLQRQLSARNIYIHKDDTIPVGGIQPNWVHWVDWVGLERHPVTSSALELYVTRSMWITNFSERLSWPTHAKTLRRRTIFSTKHFRDRLLPPPLRTPTTQLEFHPICKDDHRDGALRVLRVQQAGQVPVRALLAREEAEDLRDRRWWVHRLPPRKASQVRRTLPGLRRLEAQQLHAGARNVS